MSFSRRRFLCVSAAALCAGPARPGTGIAPPHVWQGRALGTDARVTLSGVDDQTARRVFARISREVSRIESAFSLFDPHSEISRLNRTGVLVNPTHDFSALCSLATQVHRATGGAFDPTVQPLWQALASGAEPDAVGRARAAIGWRRVAIDTTAIRLAPGQALTFNGIAQGWAADRVADVLREASLRDVLVDMGEIAALGQGPDGRPWRVGVSGPDGMVASQLTLPPGMALAVSAPRGTLLDAAGRREHILDPRGREAASRWSVVAVTAPTAAVADALSTGCCLLDRRDIDDALASFSAARLAALV